MAVTVVAMLVMAVVGMAVMMVNEGGDSDDDHGVMLMVTEKGT